MTHSKYERPGNDFSTSRIPCMYGVQKLTCRSIYAVETFGGQLKLVQLESELYVLSVLPFSADCKAYNDIMA